jgi:hypothetical protein
MVAGGDGPRIGDFPDARATARAHGRGMRRARRTLLAAAVSVAALPVASARAAPCDPQSTLRPSVAGIEDTLDGGARPVATHPLEVGFDFGPAPDGSRPTFTGLRGSAPGAAVTRSTSSDYGLVVTAARGGALPLSLTWEQDTGCTGSGQVTLTAAAARAPAISLRADGSGHGRFTASVRRPHAGDASPLRVVVRVRPASLVAPRGGRALLDALVSLGVPGPGVRTGDVSLHPRNAAAKLSLDGADTSYRLIVDPRLPSTLHSSFSSRFGVRVTLFQSGRKIGEMSGGERCGGRRRGGGAAGYTCRPVGFRHTP